ncbi:cell division protein FtsQ/DivIB [Robertkochia solimangrovi]|uniref:cell division protein FtsQ/DivIB n=1 Tax=Robertkochia solimangrovi TaxID=2213046 RepID=UPI00117CC938|nr:cell division protein FtsQ/DivIB [Robertkochia solimangrovi]TRZ44356.1 hypothetical protein DMZ48_07555 [Robertkochia solimangrovi]
MKRYLNHIKLIAILLLAIVLYSFSNKRNEGRIVGKENHIEFLNNESLFITYHTVNKLLKQNADTLSGIAKDAIDLNKIEERLNTNAMIKHADVYIAVNGEVGAKIIQRTPIARVGGNNPYYIDDQGKMMPLSSVYSARVPLVTGNVKEKELGKVFPLLEYIYNDEFLRKNVIGIEKSGNDYELEFRSDDFVLRLGEADQLDKKFNNFKAFYQKGLKDKSLAAYKAVNLNFDNQVVCTKK